MYVVSLSSQNIILPDSVKEFHLKKNNALDYFSKIYFQPTLLETALKSFEEVFQMSVPEKAYSSLYVNYADLLAQAGYLKKAIHYYDLAFDLKRMTSKQFSYSYRKQYFEKDTLLYNQKKNEFDKKTMYYYTARELELLIEVKEIYAVDQFVRNYYKNNPQQISIIQYADSINMLKIISVLEKYPEYVDPIAMDTEASLVISRHIFTAYPHFWLTYYEPRYRKAVIEGIADPKNYALLYDRNLILTTGECSFFGEWDNEGRNVNPDINLINKRRTNLGLSPLDVKKTENNVIKQIYTD